MTDSIPTTGLQLGSKAAVNTFIVRTDTQEIDLSCRLGGSATTMKLSSEATLVCPKGHEGRAPSAFDEGQGVIAISIPPFSGTYCLACYAEWLADHFPKMTPKE